MSEIRTSSPSPAPWPRSRPRRSSVRPRLSVARTARSPRTTNASWSPLPSANGPRFTRRARGLWLGARSGRQPRRLGRRRGMRTPRSSADGEADRPRLSTVGRISAMTLPLRSKIVAALDRTRRADRAGGRRGCPRPDARRPGTMRGRRCARSRSPPPHERALLGQRPGHDALAIRLGRGADRASRPRLRRPPCR